MRTRERSGPPELRGSGRVAVVGQSDSAASMLSLVSYSQSSSHNMVTTVVVLSGYFRPCIEYFWLFAKP